jgi:WD40 repeat protein
MMLLAMYQIQSGGMLWSKGILRTGEELLHMSQESKRSLWQEYAKEGANLTPRQRRKLIESRFHDVLVARLLGKQSWQHTPMRIPVDVLRHLMTKCIPRIRIAPIKMLEMPVKQAWQLTGSVFYDPSGYIADRSDWSQCHSSIKAITSHSRQPLIAVMHSDGKVWIGRTDDRENLFRLCHSPNTDAENATAMAFHPRGDIIAVAVKARIMVYRISPSLKPELHFAVSFYESGYYCPKPNFSANTLGWNPAGTFLTAISAGNLSMRFYLKPDTNEVIGGFNGGMKYAELRSFQKGDIPPSCSCFSVDGGLVMTGYSDGTLMTRSAGETDKGLTLSCSKIMNQFLPGKVDQIVPHPHNSSVFAIQVTAEWSQTSVLIVLVSHDGSVTITATIPDAKSPHFHKDWLLVSSGNKILFHHMNRCNIPCLVTEFHLQGNGMMRVEIDAFCVKTAPNGKTILYYSSDGKSKLCTAEIALS